MTAATRQHGMRVTTTDAHWSLTARGRGDPDTPIHVLRWASE